MREVLIEKQLIGADEARRQIEALDSRTPALDAKAVARACVDPAFEARLLANGRVGCEELGISFDDDTGLIVLESTDQVHSLIVGTLCSRYPQPAVPGRAERLPRAPRRGLVPCVIWLLSRLGDA